MADIIRDIDRCIRGSEDKMFDEDLDPHDFEFDDKVASIFDDMVSRSVPMYQETMMASMGLAKKFIQDGSNVYDIGCSTGTLLLNFSSFVSNNDIKLIGIDNASAMIDQARAKIREVGYEKEIELRQQSVEENIELNNASVIFMNYTLQFVRPLYRESVLKQIYEGLNPNGCFILVEKVLGNDSLYNRIYIDLYYEYKARVGYSEREIQQKREALENVLIPYRIDENIGLLKKCGFSSTEIFFKWYNFAGLVAVKE